MMNKRAAMTIVETPAFINAASRCMTTDEREELISFLALNPEQGVLIRGTGGVRKLRWSVGSKGKSGGARVIYFFHSQNMPIFLLTAYRKNRKANLSAAERNVMREVIRKLITNYGKS